MKEKSRQINAQAVRESDSAVVPEKSRNKGNPVPAEATEGRALRFTSLLHDISPELLRESFYDLKRRVAPGLDGMSWKEYESGLDERLRPLHSRIHAGSYRATPVLRTYIPKENGARRPLGITAIEDKIVQQAVAKVLLAVYDADMLGFSYGFRIGKSQHPALDALAVGLYRPRINWILDADIKAFLDTIPFPQLEGCLRRRIADPRLLRLLRKWLKTGWIEDGRRHRAECGTPQGAVISPLLANVYLHSVLDEWGPWWRTYQARGQVVIVSYADDFVVGFQHESDGRALLQALHERMRVFELALHTTKTRLIEFGHFAAAKRKRRGQGKPETFDFLGFTHLCSVDRRGRFSLRRITAKKRLRRKLQEVGQELRARMHGSLRDTGEWLRSVVAGHANYFAVPGNMHRVGQFYCGAIKHWLHAIRRRSQKGRAAWPWERFRRLLEGTIPRPRTVHPFPDARFAARLEARAV